MNDNAEVFSLFDQTMAKMRDNYLSLGLRTMCEIMEHLVTLSEFLSVRDLHASAAASLLALQLNVWWWMQNNA